MDEQRHIYNSLIIIKLYKLSIPTMDNKWGRNMDRTMTDGYTGGVYTEMELRGRMRQG